MLAMQAIVNPGDEVVVVTPVWPNLTAQPVILNAQLKTVCLEPKQGRWTLPMEALLAAVTERTRLLVINSPNNPTSWTLTREEQQTILQHCRRTGTWILADEVYENLFYLPSTNLCAPGFFRSCKEDLIVLVWTIGKYPLLPLMHERRRTRRRQTEANRRTKRKHQKKRRGQRYPQEKQKFQTDQTRRLWQRCRNYQIHGLLRLGE
jgi:bifunctional pyridoxal-dependent enzyme with beta-cystathionase and maltose regulon repressor activities